MFRPITPPWSASVYGFRLENGVPVYDLWQRSDETHIPEKGLHKHDRSRYASADGEAPTRDFKFSR